MICPRTERGRLTFVKRVKAARNSQAAWRALPWQVRLWGQTELTPNGCWNFTGAGGRVGSYGRMYVGGRNAMTPRLAWELATGSPPVGLFVCHHCDNPPCVNPAHLFIGTHSDNMRDRQRKGRANTPVGERHHAFGHISPRSSTTIAMREEMKSLRIGGAKVAAIAAQFGLPITVVGKIVAGLTARQPAVLPIGTSHHGAKLDEERVRAMRQRYAAGESVSLIAREAGVHASTAKAAIIGETWGHV